MTTNQKPIIQIEIANGETNAKYAKYITATTDAGERVVLARPLSKYEFHADIVSAYQHETGKKLENISGGYVQKQGESYIFSGSSGSYGPADHKQISSIVNGNDIKSRVRTAKDKFVVKIQSELEDLVDGFDGSYNRTQVWRKACDTTAYGSLATIFGAHAIKGYFEADASIDPATIIGVSTMTGVVVADTVVPKLLGSRDYSHDGPVTTALTNVMAVGVMGSIAAGAGYFAGLAVKRVTQ